MRHGIHCGELWLFIAINSKRGTHTNPGTGYFQKYARPILVILHMWSYRPNTLDVTEVNVVCWVFQEKIHLLPAAVKYIDGEILHAWDFMNAVQMQAHGLKIWPALPWSKRWRTRTSIQLCWGEWFCQPVCYCMFLKASKTDENTKHTHRKQHLKHHLNSV